MSTRVGIFEEELVAEEIITFTYRGDKFANHEIEIGSLVTELKGIDALLKETVEFYRKKHNLRTNEVAFDILVKVEDGSIKEIVKVVMRNATTLSLVGTFVMPFLVAGFEYYLNNQTTDNPEVVQALESSKKIRRGFEDVLMPINGDDNSVVINTGDVTYQVTNIDKKTITENIERHEELLSNTTITKEENLIGVISVSKLYDESPFNFRINETSQDIPLHFKDLKFNLEERQDFLGQELLLKASVTYKNDKKLLIEVVEFKPLEKLFEI